MSDQAHELVSSVKELASELGRTPTSREFDNRYAGARYKIARAFGNYSELLKAAGLETYNDRRARAAGKMKLSNAEVFGRDLGEVLSAHAPRERAPEVVSEPILVIGDAHFPFVHQATLEKIIRFAEKEKPAHIVQAGDLYDFFAHSKFPRSQNYYSPDQEMELGRKGAAEMWSALRAACPSAKLYQILGNHDVRPLKRVLESAPSLEGLVARALLPLFQFEGVTTIDDPRQELVIQGVTFVHGYASRPGYVRDHVLGNSVTAHTHRMSVVYRALADRIIWELNPGFIGDETAKALSYTAQKTTGFTLGWGWIDEHGPRAIPA